MTVDVQHYKEAACHQAAMERIFYEAGVDIVFAGAVSPAWHHASHVSLGEIIEYL